MPHGGDDSLGILAVLFMAGVQIGVVLAVAGIVGALTVPLIIPVVKAVGWSPIWFDLSRYRGASALRQRAAPAGP